MSMDSCNGNRADNAHPPLLRGVQGSNTRWLPSSTLLSMMTSSIYLFSRFISVVFAEHATPVVWAALLIEIMVASKPEALTVG